MLNDNRRGPIGRRESLFETYFRFDQSFQNSFLQNVSFLDHLIFSGKENVSVTG